MKLEINYTKKTEKFTNMWRLNNMLLNTQWVIEINGNVTYQNLWDVVKTLLGGKFIVINAYLKR